MISTYTSYKLAEIIRDTWPQLYRPSKSHSKFNQKLNNVDAIKKLDHG